MYGKSSLFKSSSRWHIKDKYLLLGDGEVAGNWSWGCSQCLGSISPIGDPSAAHSTDNRATTAPLTRGNRRDLLSLQRVPPVVDGLLSSEANYTGFVIMSGEGAVLCLGVASRPGGREA